MKPNHIWTLALGSAALVFLALWLNERLLVTQLSDQATDRYRKIIAGWRSRSLLQTAQMNELNRQMIRSDVELEETRGALKISQARVAQLEGNGQRQLAPEAACQLAGITGSTNCFRKLISPEGLVYGETMELSSTLGKWLIFKDAGGRRQKFAVEELHPVVLTALGLDPQAMKEEHEKLMEQKTKGRSEVAQALSRAQVEAAQLAREEAERQRQLAVETAKLREERAQRETEAALARASLEEQRRKAMADEALRRQEIEASNLRSAALLQQAEAARLNALQNRTFPAPPTPQK